ncbi:MAG: hypothetical protein LIO41_01555 [Ruminococcus sp.]|nr:hypothetical protein [Ruminococcus sp.]
MATTIIEKAHKGNLEAMKTLCDKNVKEVLNLCQLLLCDEAVAQSATTKLFKVTLENTASGYITSEEEFHDSIITKTVSFCKTYTLKKSSKAFAMPKNQNFSAVSYNEEKCRLRENLMRLYLKIYRRFTASFTFCTQF